MGTPHKHAELIKAWADGAEIQVFLREGDIIEGQDTPIIDPMWADDKDPNWWIYNRYRIKPEEKKPVVRWFWVYRRIGEDKDAWGLHSFMHSDEEAEFKFENYEYKKLEWSRTEFP